MTAQFAQIDKAQPEFPSIAETGAKEGDRVVCRSIRDAADNGHRYTVGRVYTVKNHLGRLCVEGNSHGAKVAAKDERWLIPFAGFGATWSVVQ